MKPRFVESLHDGSWLAELRPSGNAGRQAKPLASGSSTTRSMTGETTTSPTGSSLRSSIRMTSRP